MACEANRSGGRQQEPAENREGVLPVASQKPVESLSFMEGRIVNHDLLAWQLYQ